jgi:hypothetical protein
VNDYGHIAASISTQKFAAEILIEKPRMRCEAIELFRKAASFV